MSLEAACVFGWKKPGMGVRLELDVQDTELDTGAEIDIGSWLAIGAGLAIGSWLAIGAGLDIGAGLYTLISTFPLSEVSLSTLIYTIFYTY